MKFIIDDKIYDTEKSEVILEYKKRYPTRNKILDYTLYREKETTLYKTEKENWFSVASDEYGNTAYIETDKSVKKILKALNEVDIYNKHFEKLEEA